jgi:hypothetical protein
LACSPRQDARPCRHRCPHSAAQRAGSAIRKCEGSAFGEENAAVLEELKRKSGDIDILEKQIVLEQEIVGSPLILGNKVTLLQDGAATFTRQCLPQSAKPRTISA